MPRVKKTKVATNLAEENEKLSSEIAKAEARIAEAKAKMKENNERIQKEKIDKITNSGYSLDEVVTLIEVMSQKNVSIQDILSLVSDNTTPSEAAAPEITADNTAEFDKMMASLPSCD